jgi:glyoxylase-like metal-dependent hydrolase (beta-lactamase superfamily II)
MCTMMRWMAVCVALAGVMLAASPGAQVPRVFPPPLIQATTVKLSAHAYVIPDPETTLVPNVGIVVGRKATLVVDTGMGNRNGRTILAEVAKVSRNTRLYLVTTHSHAEHVSGMDAFPADTTFVVAKAQQQELEALGERGFAGMAKLSPFIGELLQGARVRKPGVVFDQEHVLDLGGVKVRLIWMGPAHSGGDTVALVEDEGVVFAGDIAPRQRFPSFTGVSTRTSFLKAMARVEALTPKVIVPSHGPYGDASVFPELRNMLDQTAVRVAPLKAQGTSVDEVVRVLVPEVTALYPTWRATVPNEVAPILRAMYAE